MRVQFASACLLMTITVFAGCLELEEPLSQSEREPSLRTSSAARPVQTGEMTARETAATSFDPCGSNVCAARTHWIEGDLTLSELPILLRSFNGNIEVQGGSAGIWNLTVVLQARGQTQATAQAGLENIRFAWSHEAGGKHALDAKAQKKNPALNNQEQASMTLRLPSAVLVDLDAATSNGDAAANGLQATGIRLATTNGRVSAQDLEAESVTLSSTNGAARVSTVRAGTVHATTTNGAVNVVAAAGDVKLQTTNGAIDARIRPTASGVLTISSTNGPVSVALAESDEIGHDVSATTTNGAVTISLEDGSASGTRTSKTFKTSGYQDRDIRTKTTVTSTNAMVTVSSL